MSYTPPQGNLISINFDGVGYTAPQGNLVALDFSISYDPISVSQYVFPASIYNLNLGNNSIRLAHQYLSPISIDMPSVGVPAVRNNTAIVKPNGWQSSNIGRPLNVVNYSKDVYPKAIIGGTYGRPLVYNLTQYRGLIGINSAAYGRPFVQGGIKTVIPRGYDASILGKVLVVNTKADQSVKPLGISASIIERPIVRPYIAHPKGIYSQAFGVQHRVGFIPAIKPTGIVQTKFGSSTTWYRVRRINGVGFNSFESGYARVFDPMRRLYIPSLITSAIFGDTSIRNVSRLVSVPGVNDGGFSDYNTLENSNRYQHPIGIDSVSFGVNDIRNKTPSIFVSNIDAPDFKVPAIGYRQRVVKTSGFDRLTIGKPLVIKTPELTPKGLLAYQSGQTTVWYKNRTIKADGFDSAEYSEKHTIWLRVRSLTPLSWVSNLNGKATLTRNVRELIATGYDHAVCGRAWASFSPRLIAPKSIFQEYPTRHLVGRLQTVAPVGYVASLFGTRIIPIVQTLYPQGFAERFGVPVIDWYTRQLFAKGFFTGAQYQALRWGYTYFYNSVQYIKQEPDLTGGLAPPKWSDWQSIANRNKSIGVTGFNSQKFGYTRIDNNAKPLLLSGIKPPTISGGMVAGAIRHISPSSIEAPYFGSYNSIHNDARVVSQKGGGHTTYGRPLVESNRRDLKAIGRIDSFVSGVPMIAYAIRLIRIEDRYSIAPPQINLPVIDNHTQYIDAKGFDSNRMGMPTAFIHFNIIAPKWRQLTNYGEARIYNVTPEMRTYGHDSLTFGMSAIRTQWRRVGVFGDTATLFGKAYISDRTKTIGAQGWFDTKLSQKHVVIKTGAPLFSEQRIDLDKYGIKVPDVNPQYLQVPKPGLNQNVIYVIQSKPNTLFGETVVRANSIRLDDGSGIATRNFGDGNRIELKNRAIAFDGSKEQIIQSEIALGKPRMSPHTIYAPKEAPSQAQANHPESIHDGIAPHYIDFWTDKGVGIALGRPKIENKNRFLISKGVDQSLIGKPKIYLKSIVVSLDKNGIAAGRPGLPKIPFTKQDLLFRDQSVDTLAVGRPTITSVLNIINNAGGLPAPTIAKHEIQLKHRWIKPISFNALSMGTSKSRDTPYMWQGLRIGEHVPTKISAGETLTFGNVFISARVRELSTQGIDSFVSEYDINNFSQRMTIKHPRPAPTPATRITAKGFVAYQSGYADTKNKTQFIKPDGNSNQFRKGGYHA